MKIHSPIQVSAINLRKRNDRKANILSQFNSRDEFTLTIIPAIEHPIGAFGLWKTIVEIVRNAKASCSDFVIICEDDHQFTKNYTEKRLRCDIDTAKKLNADVLLGGVNWFDYAVQIRDNLFWLNQFNGLQFTVVFNKFYDQLLHADFSVHDAADFKISAMTDGIFVCYPFISVQREFGYSDATSRNGAKGHLTFLFESRLNKLHQLYTVAKHYGLKF